MLILPKYRCSLLRAQAPCPQPGFEHGTANTPGITVSAPVGLRFLENPQMLKLSPQEQLLLALGLENLNPPETNSSE